MARRGVEQLLQPRATNVPHVVSHTGGTTVVEVDQDPATGSCGDWALLGDFSFDSGTTGSVVTQVPAGLSQGTHAVRLDTGGESAEAGLTVRNSSSAFTEYTESAPLSFGFHGQTNWSHELSGAPRMVQVYLMNVTPTGQYLPGDLVQVPTRAYDGNRNYQGVNRDPRPQRLHPSRQDGQPDSAGRQELGQPPRRAFTLALRHPRLAITGR